jgi:hypothetical protein
MARARRRSGPQNFLRSRPAEDFRGGAARAARACDRVRFDSTLRSTTSPGSMSRRSASQTRYMRTSATSSSVARRFCSSSLPGSLCSDVSH